MSKRISHKPSCLLVFCLCLAASPMLSANISETPSQNSTESREKASQKIDRLEKETLYVLDLEMNTGGFFSSGSEIQLLARAGRTLKIRVDEKRLLLITIEEKPNGNIQFTFESSRSHEKKELLAQSGNPIKLKIDGVEVDFRPWKTKI